MNDFSHHNSVDTLHQTLHWIQSTPPIFCRDAHTLFLDQPLPGTLSPISLSPKQLESLAKRIYSHHNPLLGIFYESLWHYVLNELPDSKLLTHNLQVQTEDTLRTLGEFDLIYQYQQNIIHRELAVKFYLGVPVTDHSSAQSSPWSNWVGPCLKDRLDIKVNRLLNHQATLSSSVEGKQTLARMGIQKDIASEVLIQGRLFYPLPSEASLKSEDQSHSSLLLPPDRCNPNHLKGYWLTQGQFQYLETVLNHYQYQRPHKHQWLNAIPDGNSVSYSNINKEFATYKRPVYITASHPDFTHINHLFVVPDDWPQSAAQYSRK